MGARVQNGSRVMRTVTTWAASVAVALLGTVSVLAALQFVVADRGRRDRLSRERAEDRLVDRSAVVDRMQDLS